MHLSGLLLLPFLSFASPTGSEEGQKPPSGIKSGELAHSFDAPFGEDIPSDEARRGTVSDSPSTRGRPTSWTASKGNGPGEQAMVDLQRADEARRKDGRPRAGPDVFLCGSPARCMDLYKGQEIEEIDSRPEQHAVASDLTSGTAEAEGCQQLPRGDREETTQGEGALFSEQNEAYSAVLHDQVSEGFQEESVEVRSDGRRSLPTSDESDRVLPVSSDEEEVKSGRGQGREEHESLFSSVYAPSLRHHDADQWERRIQERTSKASPPDSTSHLLNFLMGGSQYSFPASSSSSLLSREKGTTSSSFSENRRSFSRFKAKALHSLPIVRVNRAAESGGSFLSSWKSWGTSADTKAAEEVERILLAEYTSLLSEWLITSFNGLVGPAESIREQLMEKEREYKGKMGEALSADMRLQLDDPAWKQAMELLQLDTPSSVLAGGLAEALRNLNLDFTMLERDVAKDLMSLAPTTYYNRYNGASATFLLLRNEMKLHPSARPEDTFSGLQHEMLGCLEPAIADHYGALGATPEGRIRLRMLAIKLGGDLETFGGGPDHEKPGLSFLFGASTPPLAAGQLRLSYFFLHGKGLSLGEVLRRGGAAGELKSDEKGCKLCREMCGRSRLDRT